MPRLPRCQVAGGTYHVTARACASRALFGDSHDRAAFTSILGSVVEKRAWRCLSFSLMTTHYHLLVTTPEEDLAAGMQRLNTHYATTFNRRHAERGHVFAGRYHSQFVQSDAHLLEVCRYIALNPVHAGLCVTPEDWRWSSYGSCIDESVLPGFVSADRVLQLFADEPAAARARFRRFVEEGVSLQGLTP